MNEENNAVRESGRWPAVLHPGPSSMEDLLRYVYPAPDDETDRFIADIYADRREAVSFPPDE
jgi:hypothetical protein